jgi:hypothetical protein
MPLELYAHYMPPCLNWLQTIWAMTLYKCYVLGLFVVSGGATARPPRSAGWACQWILKETFLCIKENTIIFKKYFYTMKIVRTLKSFQLRHCLLAANSWVPKYCLGTTPMVIFVATSEQPGISFATWYFHPHPWFEGWFLRTSWELVELLRTSRSNTPRQPSFVKLLTCFHATLRPYTFFLFDVYLQQSNSNPKESSVLGIDLLQDNVGCFKVS